MVSILFITRNVCIIRFLLVSSISFSRLVSLWFRCIFVFFSLFFYLIKKNTKSSCKLCNVVRFCCCCCGLYELVRWCFIYFFDFVALLFGAPMCIHLYVHLQCCYLLVLHFLFSLDDSINYTIDKLLFACLLVLKSCHTVIYNNSCSNCYKHVYLIWQRHLNTFFFGYFSLYLSSLEKSFLLFSLISVLLCFLFDLSQKYTINTLSTN